MATDQIFGQLLCEVCMDYYDGDLDADPFPPHADCRLRADSASRSDRKALDMEADAATWRQVGAYFTRQEAEARAHNLRLIAEIAQQAADEAVAVWEAGNE